MENVFQMNGATITIWFVAFTALCFTIIIFLGGKEKATRYFAFTCLANLMWVFMMGVHVAFPVIGLESEMAYFLDWIPRIMHPLGLITGYFFLHFCISFPEEKEVPKKLSLWLAGIIFVMVVLIFSTNLIVGNHGDFLMKTQIFNGNVWAWQFGPLGFTFTTMFSLMFGSGLVILFLKKKKLQDEELNIQASRIIFPLLVAVLFAAAGSIIMPLFLNNFDFNWIASVAQIFWVVIIGNLVIRHNHMNVKHVFTELLVLAAMGLLFISLFI